MFLSVVFSFRNEEEVIPELVRRVRATLEALNCRWEIIFVNDASTDGSLQLLLGYHREDRRIKIVNLSRRFGPAAGLLAGLRLARGDAVVYLDADLQDPPELIPKLLEELNRGAEVVHTVRVARKGESRAKVYLTKAAYWIIDALAEVPMPRDAGDFKMLSRKALAELLALRESDPYMRGSVRWIGFTQAFVPYQREARCAGSTHFPLLGSLNPLREFIRGVTSFSHLPLYFPLLAGFLAYGAAFLWVVARAVLSLTGTVGMKGPWAWAVLALLLAGTILVSVGIVGLYISRIHSATQGRPPYVIENLVGFEEEPGQSDSESR